MNSLKNIKFFKLHKLLLITIFVLAFSGKILSDDLREFIQTSSGKVITQKKSGIFLWEDIPFALPPVGELRWKAPRPFIKDNLNIIPKKNNFCHQEIGGEIQEVYETGSEDCLYLDIRAPKGARKNLPVMFWIHGGGNTSGHKDFYDFTKFVKKEDVIVVSTNYRLGPLGFFTHPAIQDFNTGIDKTSNFAILDIIEALKWVVTNIEYFGGDPNNITIFGESAGGHNVLSLLVAPQAKGLFHKAISQSGYTKSSSLEDAYKSKYFNEETASDSWSVFNKILIQQEVVKTLNDADKYQVNASKETQREILYKTDPQDLVNLYGDVFETPLLTNDDIVIPKIGLLGSLGSDEHLYQVPTIAGSNKDEINLWIGFSDYFIKAEENFLSKPLGIPKIIIRDKEKYNFYSSIRAKGWQLRGVQEPLENIYKAGNEEIYAYRFDWDNLRDFFIGDFGEIIGAAHAIEIPMISGDYDLAEEFKWIVYPRSPSRRFVSKNMMNFWANFAKNAEPGDSTNNVRWSKYNPNLEKSILIIDEVKNLGISKLDLNLNSLVSDILKSDLLSDEEKCIILYETTNYIGDNLFDDYNQDISFPCSREEALRISKQNEGSIQL